MLVFGTKPETLPVSIKQDPTTGLPLLSQQDSILQFILAYLALPYSVIEFGCGKKASLIIDQLLELDIPPFSIERALILERDMSPQALKQADSNKRQHALLARNLLRDLADPSDKRLQRLLTNALAEAELCSDGAVKVGPYMLRHDEYVQFATARSHISTLMTFWDEERQCCVQKLIDPSLRRDQLFEVGKLRKLLNAAEALIFTAPLLGHFRLHPDLLTRDQSKAIGGREKLAGLSISEEAELVRELTGAEQDSIGDPTSWSYANNLKSIDDKAATDLDHFKQQKLNTGRGDAYRSVSRRLIQARSAFSGDTSAILAELRDIDNSSDVLKWTRVDANWSAESLRPLANAATQFAAFKALSNLAESLHMQSSSILQSLQSAEKLQDLRGLGVRLRRRIEWLADKSRRGDNSIDARALGEGFVAATIETIRQMNQAGLLVFIDKVGNLHGLLATPDQRSKLESGEMAVSRFCADSVWHGSHIDTVNNAGKFDGRLGVLSGIETANVLSDLENYFNIPVTQARGKVNTHVSAFIGEEMTFTGGGVSMPGSAAICSRARVEDVHNMVNGDGERFGDLLIKMLRQIRAEVERGGIELVNKLQETEDDALLSVCSDPTEFYSRHSFERHIEQGPILDRAEVPIVMVGTIMGIHQEDFFFEGPRAEEAALEMNRGLRELAFKPAYKDVRITVGIIEGLDDAEVLEWVKPALRWTLTGELNHAGATPTADRHDPGIAAARLARKFRHWCQESLPDNVRDLVQPVVSNVRLAPGTNRNVIPGSASFTVALQADSDRASSNIDEMLSEDLSKTLQAYVVGTLTRNVAGGGEGVQLSQVDPISYTSVFRKSRLTIDLRADSTETMYQFRQDIETLMGELERRFDVKCTAELQQLLSPSQLQESGQALLMERSYGGSHNPRETELLSDIVRGSVLQLVVTWDAMQLEDSENWNLFEFVEARLPDDWLERMPRFTSGALHDSCNIAARAAQIQTCPLI